MSLFDRAYENRDMDFDADVSQGISKQGMMDYCESLRVELLKGAIKKLEETDGIQGAIIKGWQGESRDKFLDNFERAIKATAQELFAEYADLIKRLSELAQDYYSQDSKMLN